MKRNRYKWTVTVLSLILTAVAGTNAYAAGESEAAKPASSGSGVGSGKYKESPILAQLVKDGKLPSVEKRLPTEPAVTTAKEIGRYGGVYRGGGFGPKHGQLDTEALRFTGLLSIEPDLSTFKPYILKDYKISEDYKTYTFILREGMRWSNGDPFTADDFVFWYNDILLNKELSASIPASFRTGSDVMKMEKVDNYTVKVTFVKGNPAFEITMARTHNAVIRAFYAPMNYLKQYHIKYNPDAPALAKKENFETWVQAFLFHCDNTQAGNMDPKTPEVWPWVLSKIDEQGNKYYDRNPYYFVVDREGNQLPYIDQQVTVLVKDGQVRTLKLISGELHAAGENPLPVKEYTLYKENESKGDYRVMLFENTRGSDAALIFNLTPKDPTLRKVFNDVRFREAASYAINRDEINKVLYFGKAKIRQAVPPSNTSFYEDWMGKYAIEYDPAKAGKMLDEAGYKMDAAGKVRLMPDGKPFNLIIEVIEEFVPMSEMIAEHLTKVGIKATIKQYERAFYRERIKAGEHDACVFTFDAVAEFPLFQDSFSALRPGAAGDDKQNIAQWSNWFNSNGAAGEEPPKEVKDLYEKSLKFSTLKAGSPEYKALGKELLTTTTKNLWFIGTSVSPRVIIISNKLGNTPTEGTFANDYAFWKPYKGDSWYFKK